MALLQCSGCAPVQEGIFYNRVGVGTLALTWFQLSIKLTLGFQSSPPYFAEQQVHILKQKEESQIKRWLP